MNNNKKLAEVVAETEGQKEKEIKEMFKKKQEEQTRNLTREIREAVQGMDISMLVHHIEMASYDPVKKARVTNFRLALESILLHTIIG